MNVARRRPATPKRGGAQGVCFAHSHSLRPSPAEGFSLEDEPPADLHAPRLEDVGVARDEAEVAVVEVHVRQTVAAAVEQVEELEAELEEGRLGDLRLLDDAQVLGQE